MQTSAPDIALYVILSALSRIVRMLLWAN